MSYIRLTVIESNSVEHPAGSRIEGLINNGLLVELAGLAIEEINDTAGRGHVRIHTALGYQFTVNRADYQQAVTE
jgi:hypothetical protein